MPKYNAISTELFFLFSESSIPKSDLAETLEESDISQDISSPVKHEFKPEDALYSKDQTGLPTELAGENTSSEILEAKRGDTKDDLPSVISRRMAPRHSLTDKPPAVGQRNVHHKIMHSHWSADSVGTKALPSGEAAKSITKRHVKLLDQNQATALELNGEEKQSEEGYLLKPDSSKQGENLDANSKQDEMQNETFAISPSINQPEILYESVDQTLIKTTTGNSANMRSNYLKAPLSGWRLVEKLGDKGQTVEFDENAVCPFQSLRTPNLDSEGGRVENVSCVAHKPEVEECDQANGAYHVDKEALRCADGSSDKLCWFIEKWRPYAASRTTARCNISPCGNNPVFAIGIDKNYGIVQDRDKWAKFTNNRELQEFLVGFVVKNTASGFGYGVLSCREQYSSKTIKQILFFPPVVPRKLRKANPDLININILMLDSVSRAHFYRSLPKTAQTLRNIVHDPEVPATALDFELLQSMAPYTFHNLRVFMSGKTGFDYKEHEEQSYDINVLYGKLRRQGYYTALQEDSCWYDAWGSFFTNNVFQSHKPTTKEQFRERWQQFKDIADTYEIDDYGLSHISCDVFKQYNVTNQFNRPKRICYNGRVFASYFLEYSANLFQAFKESGRHTPIFSYTHLNIGHEISGTRIKQIDEDLARYLYGMSHYQNTLTILFSDHGPKTTRYSFNTMEGRAEIYDSLLFMLVPKGIADILGADRMHGLITNQKRLLSTLELHHGIMSLGDPEKQNSHMYTKEGIFAPVPSNRTCADITLKRMAVCKCEGWDQRFPDNHPPFIWIAEFALGYFNNYIQRQFLNNSSKPGGFGRCQRLVGFSFEKVRRRTGKYTYTVTMDLIVLPEREIFEVQVMYPRFPTGRRDNVEIAENRRVSIYRRFDSCVDDNVSLPSCVCDSRGKRRKKWRKRKSWKWIEIKSGTDVLITLFRTRNFGTQSEIRNLHETCLLLVTRKHGDRTVAIEMSNACGDRRYRVRVAGKSDGLFVSSSELPLNMELLPRTIHFLFSVYHINKPYNFTVKTSYVAYFL